MANRERSASVRCEINRLLKTREEFLERIKNCEPRCLPLLQVGLDGIDAKLGELGQQAQTQER